MDSFIIPELQLLPRLQELNLDRTALDLKEFFRELMKKPLSTVRKLSLFNYNGDNLDEVDMVGEPSLIKFSELNNQEIDKISTCFPNLEYLNIGTLLYSFSILPSIFWTLWRQIQKVKTTLQQ